MQLLYPHICLSHNNLELERRLLSLTWRDLVFIFHFYQINSYHAFQTPQIEFPVFTFKDSV